MDLTPKKASSSDSGFVPSFENFDSIYGSTPTERTTVFSRKRKTFSEICTPQFSSTLNESLMIDQLSQCNIQQSNYYYLADKEPSPLLCPPCTPEKRIKTSEISRKSSSLVKSTPEESPLKEARSILYPNLKPLCPLRKLSSPLIHKSCDKNKSLAKKSLFLSQRDLLRKVTTNRVIMTNIFKYLSNAEIFRMSKAFSLFKDAVLVDSVASRRLSQFKEVHRKNKENYRITPPNSPEKPEDSPPSPNSRNFKSFAKRAQMLSENQMLRKCSQCTKPSVVENDVAQCESANCGYIQCLRCYSFAYSVEDFEDRCQNARLCRRDTFGGDLSNSSLFGTDFSTSFLRNSSKSESGFASGFNQTSHVKRNLDISGMFGKKKVFGSMNNCVYPGKTDKRILTNATIPIAKVVLNDRKVQEVEDPPSPPVNKYKISLKQRKKNLKRLTM